MKFKTSFTLTLLASLLLLLLSLVRVPSAHAAQTLTVTDCSSDSQLQADITTANGESEDTINFNCGGNADITLTSTLQINASMTLSGNGQSVTLDGQNQVGILQVNSGVKFTLNDLTIARGLGTAFFGSGGGLFNSGGTVSISNSTFANNSGGLYGAGLYNSGGTVSISNSTFANNSSGAGGGGLGNSGTVSISNSTFANNKTAQAGGGLYTNSGGTVSISNSTFANNSARQDGGLGNSGNVSITNSTFANNKADFFGAGLYNSGGTVSISNSTFANNSAGTVGGGLATNSGNVSIGGSIVANNSAGSGLANCRGGISDQGYNLSNDGSCGFGGTGDLQNTDPKLDPNGLQSNGGPTQTIALQAASPAIDHIPAATCPGTDQRGVTRLPGERCDIGAFEFPDTTAPTLQLPSILTVDATSPAGAVVPYTATATDDDGDSLTASMSCTDTSGHSYPTGSNVSATFPIGTTTVTCSASEPGSDTASGSFQVVVKGATAQIGDLINTVNSFGLSMGLQTSLDAKLEDALTAVNAGQTATACSDLTDFINQVKAKTGKGISTSQAQQLIKATTNIQGVLGC
jgi:hypothetical protein